MDAKLMNNPNYVAAMEYIRTHDLNALENGKHFLDGDNLFVNIVDSQLKSKEDARFEVHDRYIDIQVPLDKAETFGVKPRMACTMPIGEMNVEKDVLKFEDPIEETVTAAPGEPIAFAPDTAHAPLIGEGPIHKAIFKVKVVR